MYISDVIKFVSPRCSELGSPNHDSSKRTYTGLLSLFSTEFNHVGMGSVVLGKRDRDKEGQPERQRNIQVARGEGAWAGYH